MYIKLRINCYRIERFIESVSVTNMEDFNDGLANYNVTMEFKNIGSNVLNLSIKCLMLQEWRL